MKFSEREHNLKTAFILPERVVLSENCKNPEVLLKEAPRQAYLGDSPVAVIRACGWMILDFGRELQGGVNITIKETSANAKLRIVFGESVSEAMSRIGEKNSTNDHSIRDISVPVTNFSNFRIGNTGFRFVKIEALNCNVLINSIQAVWENYAVEYKGEFECDDELLNRIWKTGAYTTQLNMQEYIFDGIKRDRLVWIGDMHPETSTISKVFGNVDIVKKSLDFIRDVTPIGEWMNGFPSYTLWWIIINRDWYMYSGDAEYVMQQKEYLLSVIPKILEHINCDGTNTFKEKFVDWSSAGTENEAAGFCAMLVMGLNAAADLCDLFNCHSQANECRNAMNVLKRVNYVYKTNKQIAALTALAGINDINEVSNDILIPGGGNGLSAFLGYYTLIALAKSNNIDSALDIIKEYWGTMLKFGATSFWEEFDLKWTVNAAGIDEPVPKERKDIHGDFGKFCYKGFRRSLCHGWASGPTAFLSEYVLGIKICAPGCRKIKIQPQLGYLKWVKGSYPTPFGNIMVEHRANGGRIESDIKVPEGIEVLS